MKSLRLLTAVLCIASCSHAFAEVQDIDKELSDLAERLAVPIKDHGKTKVAVIDFANLDGSSAGELGKYIAEQLTVDFVMTKHDFSVLDRANLRNILAEHKLTSKGLVDPDNAKKLGQFAGVDALILGTIIPKGTHTVSLTAKIITTDLASIEKDFTEVQKACEIIAKNAAESVVGAKDYLQGSSQIASASEQAASGCVEALKSVEEQAKAYHEMNEAARSLAMQAETLKTSTNAQKSAEELAAASEELSANAEEIKAASSQISAAIEQINKAAKLQASAAESSMEKGKKLDDSAKAMGEKAKMCTDKARAVKDLLTKNKVNVDAMIINIRKTSESAVSSAKNVMELEERTRRIDKIVDSIVMVTVQTNMLAVNGNVEAARAGEFGRGFSVVAGDIRSLANESSQNADRIKDMVKSIQTQIVKVSNDISTAGKKAGEEVERAKISTTNLETIARDADAVMANIEEIAQGAEQSVVALVQANKASLQIGAAAEETARATAEGAAAAEECSKAAQEITQAVEDIASQADELQNG